MIPSVHRTVGFPASTDSRDLNNLPNGQSLAEPSATSRFKLALVMGQSCVRQALERWLLNIERLELILSARQLSEIAQADDQVSTHILLLTDQVEEALEQSAWFASHPHWSVVLLADTLNDLQIQRALQANFSGVLSKDQPLCQVEASLHSVARGERVFAPEISQRLIFSAAGLRLTRHEQNDPLASLTPRELDVLICVARGDSVKKTAERLGISASTVDNHKSRMMRKLRVHKAVELTHLAMHAGLLPTTRAIDKSITR